MGGCDGVRDEALVLFGIELGVRNLFLDGLLGSRTTRADLQPGTLPTITENHTASLDAHTSTSTSHGITPPRSTRTTQGEWSSMIATHP